MFRVPESPSPGLLRLDNIINSVFHPGELGGSRQAVHGACPTECSINRIFKRVQISFFKTIIVVNL